MLFIVRDAWIINTMKLTRAYFWAHMRMNTPTNQIRNRNRKKNVCRMYAWFVWKNLLCVCLILFSKISNKNKNKITTIKLENITVSFIYLILLFLFSYIKCTVIKNKKKTAKRLGWKFFHCFHHHHHHSIVIFIIFIFRSVFFFCFCSSIKRRRNRNGFETDSNA